MRTLQEAQRARAEASIWSAMRAVEEEVDILERLEREATGRQDEKAAADYGRARRDALQQAETLRGFLNDHARL